MADVTVSGSQRIHTPTVDNFHLATPVPVVPANPVFTNPAGNTARFKPDNANGVVNPVPHLQ